MSRYNRYGLLALALMAAPASAQEVPRILEQTSEPPRIVEAHELASSWTPASLVPAVYPTELAGRSVEGCATIGFVIEADGSTSSFSHLTGYSNPRAPLARRIAEERFAQAARDAVASWKFAPAGEAPARTFTSTTVSFSPDPAVDHSGECAVSNLTAFVRFSDLRAYQLVRHLYHGRTVASMDFRTRFTRDSANPSPQRP